ncbi:BLUF domain-containing protein [Erythrobacter colymbi]|uniref:BLUF domain-containing protein n=1 Tax=Erythrobacter colymbi TaxID=1161202 RepID=UPI000A3BB754|nr:BLUF domain-containing protein [Erythrobacter colymbi]
MRRLIYRSTASPGLDRVEMFRLVYQARVSNEARGLCGFLIQIEDRIFQVLEGKTWKLVATFENIRRDPRHFGVEVLDERCVDDAAFASWRMRYFDGRNIPRMLAQITDAAGGNVPPLVQHAILEFLGPELILPIMEPAAKTTPPAVPLRPEAALPSSPRPC